MAEANGRHILFSGCAFARRIAPPFAPSGQPARRATVALARDLHVDLWEAPHIGCCGARADLRVSEEARRATLAPLAEGEQRDLDVVCLSPACKQVVSRYVPAAADGSAVRDIVGLLTQSSIFPRLAAARNPLSGLRVALHVTCHADHNVAVGAPLPADAEVAQRQTGLGRLLGRAPWTRSRQPAGTITRSHEPADAAYVAALGRLVSTVGAATVGDVSRAGRCAWHSLLAGSISRFLGDTGSAPCLAVAARSGVDVLVTPCFLCFMGLNTHQRSLPRGHPARSVAVLHLSQLIGLAVGIAPQQLDLGRTTVSARRALLPFIA